MKYFLTLLAGFLLSTSFAQFADPTFQASVQDVWEPKGSVLLADSKYIVYGDFKRVNGTRRQHLVRFNADGTVDNTFNIGVGPDALVTDVEIQADGKILVSGIFKTFNGQPYQTLVRLLADGTIDTTFKLPADISMSSSSQNAKVLALTGGKILFATTFDGRTTKLMRLNSNGSRDLSFAEVNPGAIVDLDVQSTGKIIIAGPFTNYIARLNADGTADPTFNPGTGFNDYVYDIEVASGDAIIVGGTFTQFNSAANSYLVRLTADGAIDGTFQGNGKPSFRVESLDVQADGKIVIAGFFSAFNGTTAGRVARLTSSGALDGTFVTGTGANQNVDCVSTNAAGEVLISGSLFSFNGTARTQLAVLTSTGALKAMAETMKLRRPGIVETVVTQGDKLLVGHTSNEVNGTLNTGFVRLNADGTTDATFSGNGKTNVYVSTITLDAAGNILLGGFFGSYNSVTANRLARTSANGVLDNTFATNLGSGFNNTVTTIAVLPNDKILVGGNFTTINGVARKFLVRLNSNGTPDNTFNAGDVFSANAAGSSVKAIHVLADGKLLIGGDFTTVSGNTIRSIVRLNADGSYDNTFLIGTGAIYETSVSSYVKDIVTLSNGKYLIAGMFTKVNEIPKVGLAVLNTDGTLDNSYTHNGFSIVAALHKQPDGKILFVAEGPYVMKRLNADGTMDTSFPDFRTFAWGRDITMLGNDIISGGYYSSVNGAEVAGLIRVVIPTSDSPTQLRVTDINSSKVSLAWTDNASTETGYEIYRSVTTGPLELVQTLPANSTSYDNTSLQPDTKYNYQVRAVVAGNNSAYSNKVAQQTTPSEWTTITNTAPTRSDGVAITIGGKSYMGLGRNGTGALNDWWEFDPSGNTWTQKANFPGSARIGAVAFAANGKIYAGTGNDLSGTGFKRDIYEYDPATNVWTAKADFPEDFTSAAGITSGVAFSVNNIGYVGLGNTGSSNTTAFFKYDPTANNWQPITSFAGPGRTSAIAFATNTRGYVGFGSGGLGPNRNDLWEYNPTTNAWTQKASSNGTGRSGAAVSVLGERAYVMGGIENTTGFGGTEVYTNTTFAYDIAASTWSSAGAIPAVGRTDAAAFTIAQKIYVFGGFRFAAGNIYLADHYAFSPATSFFPLAPTNLTASYYSTNTTKLTWTDNATDEIAYVVEYAIGTPDNFTTLETLSAGTTQYLHFNLASNEQYHYRVRATNAYWNSGYSNTASRANTVPPGPPNNPEVVAETTTSATLSWTDNSTNETGFEIYRSTGTNANYSLIHTTTANVTSYVDNSFNAAVVTYYKIRAINAGGSSSYSSEATPPSAPSALDVQSFTETSVILKWNDNSNNELGFEIYKSTNDNSNFVFARTISANNINATVQSLAQNTKYVFKIRTYSQGGKSLFSNEITVTTKETVPAAPTLLPIIEKSTTSMVINWTDNSTNETGFELERGISGGGTGYTVIQTLPANTTTFMDTGLTPHTTYAYRLRAKNSGGYSVYSNEIMNFTLDLPVVPIIKPSNLTVIAGTGEEIVLMWLDNSGNETGFEVHRSVGTENNFVLVTTTGPNVTAWTDTDIERGTLYFYKVRGVNASTSSEFTDVVSKTLPPITGIETPNTWDGITAFPNPTVNRFTVGNSTSKEIVVTIYSPTGKLIHTEKIDRDSEKEINSSTWPESLYILQVSGQRGAMKIVKK